MAPIIELLGVTKVYEEAGREHAVLRDVTLAVPEGELVALLGRSGSGKSTLLNLVAGIDRPDSGTVTVAGQDLGRLSPRALADWRAQTVGYVFQQSNLVPVLTAFENVELPLHLFRLGRRERERRVRIALEAVGLTDRADHLPSQLSGGQEQRVAIARAIVTDPEIVVGDEPTGDLDAKNAEEVLGLLRTLKQEFGKTVVIVTHDPRAERYVDEVLLLDKGVYQGARPGGGAAHMAPAGGAGAGTYA
jgi:putative ABC transport system ATP-binding protein